VVIAAIGISRKLLEAVEHEPLELVVHPEAAGAGGFGRK